MEVQLLLLLVLLPLSLYFLFRFLLRERPLRLGLLLTLEDELLCARLDESLLLLFRLDLRFRSEDLRAGLGDRLFSCRGGNLSSRKLGDLLCSFRLNDRLARFLIGD